MMPLQEEATNKAIRFNSKNMRTLRLITLVTLGSFISSCATDSVEMRTFRIAGGESVQLPIARGGAKATENADLKIEETGFVVDGKEVIYTFGFTMKQSGAPRFVKVEDVSGNEAEVLVTDASPQLSGDRYWKGDAKPRTKGDPGLAWLSEPGDTIKVFRFTITTADGRQLIMHQASVWSGSSKPLLRKLLGYQEG